MANRDPGIESDGGQFASQAQEFVESVEELQALPISEQDRVTDVVAMTLEDMDHRLADKPVTSGHYLGVDLTILEDQERLILVRGEKHPDGVKSDLTWFADALMIADLKQNQL